ncbi:hypothetical protein D1114_23190 [Cereibacter sphaeroides]|uniref:Uncharacterized protein n=1 Tax=Cereibacter sphaeroides TaxID=1063 RepID=A0AAX1UEU6_CERSP|nr:hypothetical protein [Cereibacter sphaeroides]RHZ90444.1 hypothetical protein D1114_23190 [Cereibacter sphaeroides]
MDLKEKIEQRFDNLEKALIAGNHLTVEGAADVAGLISQISKFASILTDEQMDYINAAKFAVSDNQKWK